MRGRSEATSLARCRAQIEHRRRDGRRIRRGADRCSDARPKACNDRDHRGRRISRVIARGTSATSGPGFPARTGPDCPDEVGSDCRAISATLIHGASWTRRRDSSDDRHGHRQPWRERPLRTRAGPFPARAPGSLTPWFPALIAAPVPAQWAAKNAAHRAGVAPSRWNLRPENRLSAMLAGVRRSRSCCTRGSSRTRSGGQPRFPRSSPRSSSAVGIRRRQPGGRDAGTVARARRTQPVRVRGQWRRPRWASRPSRACSGARPTTVGRGSIQRRVEGAGDVEVACVSGRGARFGEPLPFGEQPLQRLHNRRVQWCRELLSGGVQIGQSGLHELTGKKQPDCPSEQHAEQRHVPQQEQPEVHRRGTRHEVDEDVGVACGCIPIGSLSGK